MARRVRRFDFLVLIPPTTGVTTYRAAVARDLLENYPEAIGPKPAAMACRMEFFDQGMKRRDLDVLSEGVLEALIKAGVMKDDVAIETLITSRSTDGPAGFVRVTLLELDDVTKNAIAKPYTLQPWADGSLQSGPEEPPAPAKAVNAKSWGLAEWNDGTFRSWPEPGGVGAQEMKWNPGHYVRPNEMVWLARQSERFAIFDQIENVDAVKGGLVNIPWGMIEGPAQGVYDWTLLDAEVAKLASIGKKLIIEVWVRKYGGSIPSVPQSTASSKQLYLPDYVISNGWAAANTDDVQGYQARLDITACMDRFIALMQAIAARYDTNPTVELVQTNETSAGFASGSGFSQENFYDEWLRLTGAMRDAFEHTGVAIMNNFMHDGSGDASIRDFVAEQFDEGAGLAVPDVMAGAYGQGSGGGATYDNWNANVYRGAGTSPGDGKNYGTTDYRGTLLFSASQEVIWKAAFTPANVLAMARDVYRVTHLAWTAHGGSVGGTAWLGQSEVTPVPAMRWVQGVLPYITLNPLTSPNTTFPSRLAALGFTPES